METNFFTALSGLDINGDLQMVIAKGSEGKLLISVMVRNDQCGDKAARTIPPLTLNANAADLDKGFFETIAEPLAETADLMTNMEAYRKAQEEARRQSAVQKDKKKEETKEVDKRTKKYNEGLAEAEKLEKEGKHRDAWMKVPDPSEYPEHADFLKQRRSELSRHFAPDLFNA